MNLHPEPLVSVVTPVYNGEPFLAECIESILRQTYKNFEYIIVNNCSTDGTMEIALAYAKKDSRIQIHSNDKFVGGIENHNIAFSLISPESKYCKVVSADDFIFAGCIMQMVKVAETNPSIGIVGSYQLSGDVIKWKGLPENIEVISGREVCRLSLIKHLNVFGTPTSSLYRSELVRNSRNFYPHSLGHADTTSCYKYLEHSDFGFVHDVLSIERIHHDQLSTGVNRLWMHIVNKFEHRLHYGPIYLSDEEYEVIIRETLNFYYKGLGRFALKMQGREFWKYHYSRMKELGYPVRTSKVITSAISVLLEEIKHPVYAYKKMCNVLKDKYHDLSVKKSSCHDLKD